MKMDSSYEKRLEQEIDRELKGLRELRAPEALVGRVLRAIAQPVCLPWYRRSWQTWPMAIGERCRWSSTCVRG